MFATLASAAASAGIHVPPRPIASPTLSAVQSAVDTQQPIVADPCASSMPAPSALNNLPKLPKEAITLGLDSNRLGRCCMARWFLHNFVYLNWFRFAKFLIKSAPSSEPSVEQQRAPALAPAASYSPIALARSGALHLSAPSVAPSLCHTVFS
jgi:hypothetical protein